MGWGLFVSFNKSVSLFDSEEGRAVLNSWYVFKVSFKEYCFFSSPLMFLRRNQPAKLLQEALLR